MRVIVGCEYSQIVTMAFREKGHEAYSCDIIPCEGGHPEWHFKDDIFEVLKREKFDMGIFHPPCTYLSIAGYHYSLKDTKRMKKTIEALEFFKALYSANINKICCENPVSMVSTFFKKPSQIIQPWMFGDSEIKTTCLWLKGLPPLLPTTSINVKPNGFILRKSGDKKGDKYNYYWRQGKSAKIRSKTFPGIAAAMANQWG